MDALRAIAAVLVVADHSRAAAGIAPLPIPDSSAGVSIFFVLSGYLITDQLLRRPDDVKGFLIRRAARILPAYWLAVLALGIGPQNAQFLADPFGYFTMTHPIHTANPGEFLAVSWSLRVELLFYLAAPLIVRLPVRWWFLLAAVSFFIAVLPATALVTDPSRNFPGALWRFLPGMLIARYQGSAGGLVLAGILLLPSITMAGPWIDLFSGLAAGILVSAAVARPWAIRGSAAGAALSYPLYLWHDGLLQAVPWAPAALGLSVAVATASYRLVERPIMRLRANALVKMPQSPPIREAPAASS